MEKIELFLNELSWEKWSDNFSQEDDLAQAFRNLYRCLKTISETKTVGIKVLAHQEKLVQFVKDVSDLLEDKNLIFTFRKLVFENLNIYNWTENATHTPAINYYYLPGLIAAEDDRLLNGSSVAEIAEKRYLSITQTNTENYLLINLIASKYGQESVIQVIREDIPKPRVNIDIAFIENESAFKEWILPFQLVTTLLENSTRFLRTTKRFQGKIIYQEIETGYYWYFDNFHKDFSQKDTKVLIELEVFDKQGLHIGTADAKQGILNRENKVKGRKINIA